jgi:Putative prokaryotic signal transducing protein
MMQRLQLVAEDMAQDDRWTQVATTSSQVEAEMLRDLLVGEGIGSLVQTNDAAAYLGVISQCRVLVREDDLDRAAAFLDAWEASSPPGEENMDAEDGNGE